MCFGGETLAKVFPQTSLSTVLYGLRKFSRLKGDEGDGSD